MPKENVETSKISFIRELCKDKTEAEIVEAEDNFRDYLLLLKDMLEDIAQSPLDAQN